jgi:hypothetical protein
VLARAAAPLLLSLLSIAVFAPFTGGGFVTDDFAHIARLEARPSLREIVATPDAFGFYRPVTQASLWLEHRAWGLNAPAFRRTNVALHALVVLTAWIVARRLLDSTLAATLAALTFLLTPKAHPAAVLWISGRAELLMALFVFLAVHCWLQRRAGQPRRGLWLAGATAAYGCALLSKESAVLLPLLLLCLRDNVIGWKPRLAAIVPFAAVLAVALALRIGAGALLPLSADEHYNLGSPFGQWIRNLTNYVPRAIPAPLALLALVGVPLLLTRVARHERPPWPLDAADMAAHARLGVVWFLVFIAPVLGIPLRNELYLYLPVFGPALMAGYFVAPLAHGGRSMRPAVALVTLVTVAFVAYQVARNIQSHEAAVFSQRIVTALASHAPLKSYRGAILLHPADATTEQLLRTAVRYVPLLVPFATGRSDLVARASYDPAGGSAYELVMSCAYRNGRVVLTSSQ